MPGLVGWVDGWDGLSSLSCAAQKMRLALRSLTRPSATLSPLGPDWETEGRIGIADDHRGEDKPPTPPPLTRDRARGLRRASTEAEQKLWARLRNNRLMEAKFRGRHPIGPYVADLFCLEAKLVVELDGGGHDEDHQRRLDKARTQYLESRGYKVLRFWNSEVTQNINGVLDTIVEQLTASPRRERPREARVRDRSA